MMKTILLLLISFSSFALQAQIVSRVMVEGKINAPVGDDVEGVVIFNQSTNKGTVTDPEGNFNISVGINDQLEVSAMQYQKFSVLIDKGIVTNKKLNIYLNESVNYLDEVLVLPYDLSGNVKADVKRIDASTGNLGTVIAQTSNEINDTDYEWTPDQLTEVQNNAIRDGFMENGLNFVNLFKLAFQNKSVRELSRQPKDIDVTVRKIYDDQFFKQNLALEMTEINDFIFFAEGNGLDKSYLKSGKELDLIEFLIEQSKLYKQQNKL